MQALPYWQVNAFVAPSLTGNPAVVVRSERQLSGEAMQSMAAEFGAPATAFLWPDENGQADYSVRWFSPQAEIELCGHASLASGHVLLETQEPGVSISLTSADGTLLELKRTDRGYELALPAIPTERRDLAGLGDALGARPVEILFHPHGYALAIFDNADEVRKLAPDLAALGALGNWQVAASAPGSRGEADIVSRVFTHSGGEDAVTGSAHAALVPYWSQRLGRKDLRALQASVRGGMLDCRMEGERVWIGGACETVSQGSHHLSG